MERGRGWSVAGEVEEGCGGGLGGLAEPVEKLIQVVSSLHSFPFPHAVVAHLLFHLPPVGVW